MAFQLASNSIVVTSNRSKKPEPKLSYWASYKATYFSNNPDRDAWIYLSLVLLVLTYTIICIFAEIIPTPCTESRSDIKWGNPAYDDSPCLTRRYPSLLWLNRRECDFGRRILVSVILGAIIGFERRAADRPAGIRTMSLTSLGACAFSLSSMFSFSSSPQAWDSSRVAAAIPSGVGFLGAGLIWKGFVEEGNVHRVYGLTTAASIWLSAAVGVASGGALYFVGVFVTASVVVLLRFGPRMATSSSEDDDDDEEDEIETETVRNETTVVKFDKEAVDLPAETSERPNEYSPLLASPGQVSAGTASVATTQSTTTTKKRTTKRESASLMSHT